MKIKRTGLFHTPKSMTELEELNATYVGSERHAFTMGMMLTWNYIAYMLEQETKTITEEENNNV